MLGTSSRLEWLIMPKLPGLGFFGKSRRTWVPSLVSWRNLILTEAASISFVHVMDKLLLGFVVTHSKEWSRLICPIFSLEHSPWVSAKAIISLYRATIHWTIVPPTPLQIGCKARTFIKNAQVLKMGSLWCDSLKHYKIIKEFAFSIFGGWGWKKRFANGIFGVDNAIMGGI